MYELVIPPPKIILPAQHWAQKWERIYALAEAEGPFVLGEEPRDHEVVVVGGRVGRSGKL